MPAKQPRPLCSFNIPDLCSTPGTLGVNDAADVTHPVLIPRTRRLMGAIELAEKGEIVLAQGGTKLSLTVAKAQAEDYGVILTSLERGWYQWAKQYASKQSRSVVPFPNRLNRAAILKAYTKAAGKAKNGGLIVSAGHGFSRGFAVGAVDLAPKKKLRLASQHFEIRANPKLTLLKKDQQLMNTFLDIGKILKKYKVKRVLFISCLVGKSWDFLQYIANDWNVTVVAYTKLVVPKKFLVVGPKYRRVRRYGIYLKGKVPRTNDKKLRAIREYPALAFGDAWKVKPKQQAASKTSTKK